MRKAIEQPILILIDVSPDGNWILAWSHLADGDAAFQVFPTGGGSPVLVSGWTYWRWSRSGNIGKIPQGQSYLIPLVPGQTLPSIPAGGFRSEEDLARLPGARKTDELNVIPGPSLDVYAFYRSTTQRNLYRIPVP